MDIGPNGGFWLIFAAWALGFASCKGGKDKPADEEKYADTADIRKNAEVHVDLSRMLFQKRDPPEATVQVRYDPIFRGTRTYKGFLVTPILDSVIKGAGFDTGNAIVVF